MLKTKSTTPNEDYLTFWNDVPKYITREEVDAIFETTFIEMEEVLQPYKHRPVSYTWSGSKESLVLAHMLDMIETDKILRSGVQSIVPLLEFPAFVRWSDEVRPIDVSLRSNHKLNMKWLQGHGQYLFPANANYRGFSFCGRNITAKNIENYIFDRRPHILLFGKTHADGNYIQKDVVSRGYHGCVFYNPLRDWSLEQVFGYLHYHCIELPPHYLEPGGFTMGTAPWPARTHCKDRAEGWAITYKIDPSVVVEAAYFFSSAGAFLDGRDE